MAIANKRTLCGLVALVLVLTSAAQVDAGQGCPFDDGSCQEYCGQQGCHLGYCGHFAWIQCICRKCGDEWSWYDKVRYNPDKTVNQTELDSLKLNGTEPIQEGASRRAQPDKVGEQTAKLTTLLIPDLSDSGRDANDIPDENSDKFIDYLAKNHEKLVQSAAAGGDGADDDQPTSTLAPPTDADELVEIQISSSDNATGASAQPPTQRSQQQTVASQSALSKLLRVAVSQRSADEID